MHAAGQAIFNWSVATFETVFNIGNCDHICLKKDINSFQYRFCPAESFPQHRPFATRKLWLRLKALQPDPEIVRKIRALKHFRNSEEASRRGGRHVCLSNGMGDFLGFLERVCVAAPHTPGWALGGRGTARRSNACLLLPVITHL